MSALEGTGLVELRKAYGFSQQELAAVVGTTQTTISRWESGREAPSRSGPRQVLLLLEEHREVLQGSLRHALIWRGPLYAYYLLLRETYRHVPTE